MKLLKRLVSGWRQLVAPKDHIEHIVLLMFENHSFDQMLGCFKEKHSQLEGIDPANLKYNTDSTGQRYYQQQANDTVVDPDPMHELNHVLNQLKDGNSGFVSEYEKEYQNTPTPTDPAKRQRIMDYFGMGDLPALHQLAEHFTICDHWYASVPGPTWTNRFFVLSGTAKGLVTMPTNITQKRYYWHYDQDTIFDRLNDGCKKWRIYFGDFPQSLVLAHQRYPKNAQHYHLMSSFYTHVSAGDLPEFTFIEPNYSRGEQNDDHPPFSTVRAQRLLAHVYNALRASPLWESTLLVVLYDEHGGFYDHVEPPKATVPDTHQDEYTFDRFGVRVPALLISAWTDPTVINTPFDHTSLLRYLIDKWGLKELTDRVRDAKSIAPLIRKTGVARSDCPESVTVPPPVMAMMAHELPVGAAQDITPTELEQPDNDLQIALKIFADHLAENEMPTEALAMKATAGTGPLADDQQAKLKFQTFLAKQKAKEVGG